MKIVNCIQGSAEWLDARRGRPTASRFSAIVTATGKATTGQSRRSYMLELLGERLTGSVTEHYVSAAMQRGTDLEPRARAWYELTTGRAVEQVGFVLARGSTWGASPDGLTDTGGIEIKCLGRPAHLDALLTRKVPPDYAVQMQACMWVCRRKTWDFVLFTDEDGIPSATWAVEADPQMHKAFAEHVPVFCKELAAMEKQIQALAE